MIFVLILIIFNFSLSVNRLIRAISIFWFATTDSIILRKCRDICVIVEDEKISVLNSNVPFNIFFGSSVMTSVRSNLAVPLSVGITLKIKTRNVMISPKPGCKANIT